ncbi:J domain-containing protein [Natronobiforma cellulositropha]|uniref:J domain-containing protein n=1 Tax=Natronobiforma cellulositropha TaxID=1679076 RepID=UPI0021D5B699|nr:J domain-containing protein [Natronobiforma cellulositropha]
MAVADERREGCDGCGRVVSLEDLTTVSMPDGDSLACCPACEPHARKAAKKLASLERHTEPCDGCTDEFPQSELEDVVLTDGTVITCCRTCLRDVPGYSDGETDTSVTASSSDDETTELATPRNLCSQCHEWTDVELFHVTTIDGRTEEMCPDCKDLAEQKGVVTDVKMRKAEAWEILGLEAGAADAEIRKAFLQQIKRAHPDRKSGSRSAFKLVKEAYDRLK